MWLSKRERQAAAGGGAMTGPVTVPGDPVGVWLEGERRGVRVYAPGGYHWVPGEGSEVLVLKAGEQGEVPCALGVPVQGERLRPGEVLITGGGCALKLGTGGRVEVSGTFVVNGTVVGPLPPKEEEGE